MMIQSAKCLNRLTVLCMAAITFGCVVLDVAQASSALAADDGKTANESKTSTSSASNPLSKSKPNPLSKNRRGRVHF